MQGYELAQRLEAAETEFQNAEAHFAIERSLRKLVEASTLLRRSGANDACRAELTERLAEARTAAHAAGVCPRTCELAERGELTSLYEAAQTEKARARRELAEAQAEFAAHGA